MRATWLRLGSVNLFTTTLSSSQPRLVSMQGKFCRLIFQNPLSRAKLTIRI